MSFTGSADRPTALFVLSNWFGFTLQLGALVVLLPLHLESLGFGVDAIAAVTGAAGLGGVASADLVGRLANRLGPVRLLRLGIAAMAAAVVGIGLASHFVVLLALHGMVGVATAMVRVSSQMVVGSQVEPRRRGRVHAWQGQTTRFTMLIIPLLVGVLWEWFAAPATFVFPILLTVIALVLGGSLVLKPAQSSAPTGRSTTPLSTMLRYASGPILFTAARAGRMLLLPLIGLELDLSPTWIGALVALSSAADLLASPVSGPLMDRRGRLATIIPSFALTSIGFVILAIASGPAMTSVAAVVLGLGNGLSAGLLLTLGTDLAPAGNEGPFLGRFGALHDIGRLAGPFLVGLLGELFSLGGAALALAATTAVGLACTLVFVGETRPT